MRQEYKIVISGLDNAGKTSSLIALRHKYNFYERVKNLKPTIKIDYSSFKFLDTYRINLWDMGGQKKFRKIYLGNPIYFTETDYLYYLIDIQDELKFEESVEYLHSVLDIYRELNYSNEVIIIFSKYDPIFKKDSDYDDRRTMLENLICSQNKDMKFKFFCTSYYDISSISLAISYSLNRLLKLDGIDTELKRFIENYDCRYIILYTNSGLVISDHYNEVLDTLTFEQAISSKINDDLEFFQRLKDENVDIDERTTIIESMIDYVKKYQFSYEDKENIVYLATNTPSQNLNEIQAGYIEIHKTLVSFFS